MAINRSEVKNSIGCDSAAACPQSEAALLALIEINLLNSNDCQLEANLQI